MDILNEHILPKSSDSINNVQIKTCKIFVNTYLSRSSNSNLYMRNVIGSIPVGIIWKPFPERLFNVLVTGPEPEFQIILKL
jgi:hypothetical protein